MNVRDSSDRSVKAMVVILVAVGTCVRVDADIPGRGGSLLTPYPAPAHPNLAAVVEAKRQASTCRYLRDARVRGSAVPLYGARLGFMTTTVEPEGIADGQPEFAFTLRKKQQMTVVELSEVQSLRVTKIQQPFLWLFGTKKALVEVVLFPVIAPDTLLSEPIGYQELCQEHTRTIAGWVHLRADKGRDLCLVAEKGGVYRVLCRVEDLELKRDIVFDNRYDERCLWWAVDSVIQDSSYPYLATAARD